MVLFFCKTIDDQYVLFDEVERNLIDIIHENPNVFGKDFKVSQGTYSPEVANSKMNGKLWNVMDISNEKKSIEIFDFKPDKKVLSELDEEAQHKKTSRVSNKPKEEKMIETTQTPKPEGEEKPKRHRRTKEEMAAARGEEAPKKEKVVEKKRKPRTVVQKVEKEEPVVTRILLLKTAMMIIYSDGSTGQLETNGAPIFRVDPKTGEMNPLSF